SRTDLPTSAIYTLSLHDALPIFGYDAWTNIVQLIDWVCANWRQPDEGIWEVRGGRQEFLYSRVMCWVAIDRAIRLATKRSFPAPDRKSTRLNSSHDQISYAVFCL